jgi:hypothetical protein
MKYSGSCQCGKVTFDVDTQIDKVISCNCSRCRRLDALTEYRFNKHVIHHYFCSACGIQPYAEGKGRDGSDMVMINVRCLEGVDPTKFEVMEFDGASM